MKSIKEIFNQLFSSTPVQPLKVGIYHYQAAENAEFPYRLHLRVEPDGSGILIVNAKTVLHLNQTATEYTYHLVNQTPHEEMIKEISRRYQVSDEQSEKDFSDLAERLRILVSTPDLDPVTFLGFDRESPYNQKASAPYRLDCALTYRLMDESSQNVAPLERVDRELISEEWESILEKAWNAGIPHVIFTGGEPTLRPDLKDLIQYAENLGMVTGLITGGTRLTTIDYLQDLLQCGLDHLMIVLDENDEQCWEAIRDTMTEDIFLTVHITITPKNADKIEWILDELAGMLEPPSISLSVNDLSLKDQLQTARQSVMDHNLQLVWDLPAPYSHLNPVSLELESANELPQETGHAWLYVEPDGDVLRGQGQPEVLGNLLKESWDEIWKKV